MKINLAEDLTVVPESINCTDIMVDLETLGTDPDAAIISIAAVAFDLRSGAIGREFLTHIDVGSNLQAARVVNPETLAWWIDGDNNEVFAKWCKEKKDPLPVALHQFELWLMDVIRDQRSYQVWGNSNRFDLGLLANAYGGGDKIPWNFYAERDVRTLSMFNEEEKAAVKREFKDLGIDLHNPIVDCKLQIEYCHRIYNQLKPLKINDENAQVINESYIQRGNE